jgi:hypothetical protein
MTASKLRLILAFMFAISSSELVISQDATIPCTESPDGKSRVYAFIVGVDNYTDNKLDTLHYAASDAKRFKKLLEEGYVPDKVVEPENIWLYTDSSARFSNLTDQISDKLQDLRGTIHCGDEIFFFWSGHGVMGVDDQNLLCYDTKIKNVDLGKLSRLILFTSMIKGNLAWFAYTQNVKVFLIVDACRDQISLMEPNEAIATKVNALSGPGEIYFYSCHQFKPSYESTELNPGSGVFSYFFISGLLGGADYDKNGRVTVSELRTFLNENVNLYVKAGSKDPTKPIEQEPLMYSRPANEGIVMTYISQPLVDTNRSRAKRFTEFFRTSQTTVKSKSLGQKGISNKIEKYIPTPVEKDTFKQTSGRDTLFDKMLSAIERKNLIYPPDSSAYHYFELLKETKADRTIIRNAHSHLFIALLEAAQNLIDNYLEGKLLNARPGQFKEAYDELSTALQLNSEDTILANSFKAKLLFLETRYYAGSNNPKDWDKGLSLLNKNIERTRFDASLYHTKGILYEHQGKYLSAIKCFDTALLYTPKWIYPKFNLAANYYNLQEYEKSIKYCNEIINTDSTYTYVYSLLGLTFEAIEATKSPGKYEKAEFWNLKALHFDSTNTSAYLNLGNIYTKRTDQRTLNLTKAEAYYRQGASQLSEACLTMLGQFNQYRGFDHFDSATYYYVKSLAINPFNPGILSSYASLLEVQGETKSVDSLFSSALEKSGNDYKIYNAYRSLLFRRTPKQADSVFNIIAKINSEDPRIFVDHSLQYEQIDSLQKAIAIIRRGLKYQNSSPMLNSSLARLYFTYHSQLGNEIALDSSEKYLQIVKRLDPESSLADYNLSQLYLLQGKKSISYGYRDSAKVKNEYVTNANTFSRDLLAAGDSARRKRQPTISREYYRTVLPISRSKVAAYSGIATTYYIENNLDSAAAYASLAANTLKEIAENEDGEGETDHTDEIEKIQKLVALINFDHGERRNIRSAKGLFSQLSWQSKNAGFYSLERALCYFKLGKIKKARSIVNRQSAKVHQKYLLILTLEGIDYSANFVANMKNFTKSLGLEQ